MTKQLFKHHIETIRASPYYHPDIEKDWVVDYSDIYDSFFDRYYIIIRPPQLERPKTLVLETDDKFRYRKGTTFFEFTDRNKIQVFNATSLVQKVLEIDQSIKRYLY